MYLLLTVFMLVYTCMMMVPSYNYYFYVFLTLNWVLKMGLLWGRETSRILKRKMVHSWGLQWMDRTQILDLKWCILRLTEAISYVFTQGCANNQVYFFLCVVLKEGLYPSPSLALYFVGKMVFRRIYYHILLVYSYVMIWHCCIGYEYTNVLWFLWRPLKL